jgi:hypothetical protein
VLGTKSRIRVLNWTGVVEFMKDLKAGLSLHRVGGQRMERLTHSAPVKQPGLSKLGRKAPTQKKHLSQPGYLLI